MNFRIRRTMLRVVAALGLAATLGGCVIAPYPFYPYRPHYYRY